MKTQNNNNLPKGWRKVKLGEILKEHPQYGYTASATDKKVGPKFLRVTDIVGYKVEWAKVPFCKISEEEKKKYLLNKGDIVFARAGTVGYTFFVKENPPEETIFASYLIRIKIDEKKYDPVYVSYFLKSPFYWGQVNNFLTGTSQPGINATSLRDFELLIPEDINEQKRIAAILSAFDDKIELNNKIIKTLEEMAQEIFKEWFVRFRFPGWQKVKFVDSELGKIPEGWEISKIGEKLTTILGGTPSTSNKSYWENGDIPWINSGAINDFPIINPTNFITKKGLENSAAKLMSVKTVVLPLVISIGKPVNISMLAKEMSGNQSVVGIVGNDKITPEYIYCWVQYKKQEIYGSASGGAQQHINKNIIDSTLILIPKGEILDSFNRKVVPFFDTIIKKAFENQTLAILRDLLLPKLMSGEILVNSE